MRRGNRWFVTANEVRRKLQKRKVVMNMPTKRELERQIEDMEEKLEAARDLIDEALGLESNEEDDSSETDDDD
jgi:hypothetical protein